jgi:hypothetical protein
MLKILLANDPGEGALLGGTFAASHALLAAVPQLIVSTRIGLICSAARLAYGTQLSVYRVVTGWRQLTLMHGILVG